MYWTAIVILVGVFVLGPSLYFLLVLLKPKPDDLLKEPEIAYRQLEEQKYKAEQELADRYKSFVTEILRLSLAGIAVFGFLYNEIFQCSQTPDVAGAQNLAAIGVVMFAASAVYALFFLYSAAEAFRYYVVGLRHYVKLPAPTPEDIESARNSLGTRDAQIHVCRWSKLLASLALGLGGVFMAAAIFRILVKF